MQLLHIIATPRVATSHTLRISDRFVQRLEDEIPGLRVETLDLFDADLPAVAGDNIETKYTLMMGGPIDRRHAESWQQIERLVERFQAADIILISAPMWNFSIPYALKYYIDAIVQPGYLFGYDAAGVPIGLCHGKTLVCITTRGADYSAGPMRAYDHQESYLRAIFGFVGVTDQHFIHAQPMDFTPQLRESAVAEGISAATGLATALAESRRKVLDPLPA